MDPRAGGPGDLRPRKFFAELLDALVAFARREFDLGWAAGEGLASKRLLLEDYESRSGKRDGELDADPCPEPLRYLWHAFCELSAARGNNGFGAMPLQWSEIEAWARLSGHVLMDFERQGLAMLDRCYLEIVAQKGKK